MAKATVAVSSFNRGLLSRYGVARVDLKRTALSAEVMTNFMPRVLGSMALRPGMGYIGGPNAGAQAKMIPFVFSTDDTAIVECTNLAMRVWIDDVVLTRVAVATAIANGTFDTALTSWTASAGVTWYAGGYAQFASDGTTYVTLDQTITVSGSNANKEHAVRVNILRGPVFIQIGSSAAGGEQYIANTELMTGLHSLAFTPAGNFYVRLRSRLVRPVYVDSIQIEAAGAVVLATPWTTPDLRNIRWDQSGDVLFIACKGYQQRRIERHAIRSWSIVLYAPEDGPFRVENTTPTTITPSGLNGSITLTASVPEFKSTQVGGLYRITSSGQRVTAAIAAQNTFTNSIVVTGVEEERRFTIEITGVWTTTVTLQRSVGVTGNWTDVSQYTTNASTTYADGLDNQIVYYRIGIKTGDYAAGTATCTLTYTLGSITGVARITGFTSNVLVNAEVLKDLGGTTAVDTWSEGSWSVRRGYPTSVAFYEGRLWWSGKNGVWGSISDVFDGFDPAFEGDAGTINRSVGSGPVDDINWILPMQRLILGAEGAEWSVRSTTFDEPLTPTNFSIKDASTQGSCSVPAVKVDSRGMFVQRSGQRVYQLAFNVEINDYASTDITALVPEIGATGIVAMAVQRQPDTRIHCVLNDGTVAVAVVDPAEDVLAWVKVETNGSVEDVCVLPGSGEDAVYYAINRAPPGNVSSVGIITAGTYTQAPALTITGDGSGAEATCLLGLTAAVLTTAGAGYVIFNTLTISGGTADTTAQIVVDTVNGAGAILTFHVVRAGKYSAVPNSPSAVTGGAGAGATFTLTFGIVQTTVTNGGAGYTSAFVSAATTYGSGANLVGVVDGGSSVQTVTVTNGGALMYLQPTLSFSGGGGSGATAIAVMGLWSAFYDGGAGYTAGDVLTVPGGTYTSQHTMLVTSITGTGSVNAITVLTTGDYSVLPEGTLDPPWNISYFPTGGSGSGFRYRSIYNSAYTDFRVKSVQVTSGGSGYAFAPTVGATGGQHGGSTAPVLSVNIGGAITEQRTIERWALENECRGNLQDKQSDSFILYNGPTTATITGLDHLNRFSVVVWADGKDFSPDVDGVQRTYFVDSGQIALDEPVSEAVVGIPYQGRWQSTKLARTLPDGNTMLSQRKKVSQIGLLMLDTHNKAIKYGPDFDTLDPMPDTEQGLVVPPDNVYTSYDQDMFEFNGEWNTDSRVCIEAYSPRPCTLLALVIAIESHGKD